jgi:hypothetical protein
MKKLIVISLFTFTFSLCTSLCQAQDYVRNEGNGQSTQNNSQAPPSGFGQNFSIGGSFGAYFGGTTYIGLEPLLSYHFNKNFMVGVGTIYQYVSVDEQVYGYAYSSSSYGGRVTALYFLPDQFSRVFIMGEYDVLNVPELSLYTYQVDRGTLAMPMVGIGWKEPVSDKLFFCIYGLWNFNNSIYNPYSNPVINAGFDIGLWQ